MKGVVLAAGKGTRLRPLTTGKPKPLVKVCGTPLVEYPLESLEQAGVTDVVIVVGYEADETIDYLGTEFGSLELTYVHQEEQLGVAHALEVASERVNEPFLCVYGDYIFDFDLSPLFDGLRTDVAATALTDTVSDQAATQFGVCEFNPDGELRGFVEKPTTPPSNTVVTGGFGFDPIIFDACRVITPSDRGEYELPAALDLLLYADHEVNLVESQGFQINVNDQADLAAAESYLSSE